MNRPHSAVPQNFQIAAAERVAAGIATERMTAVRHLSRMLRRDPSTGMRLHQGSARSSRPADIVGGEIDRAVHAGVIRRQGASPRTIPHAAATPR